MFTASPLAALPHLVLSSTTVNKVLQRGRGGYRSASQCLETHACWRVKMLMRSWCQLEIIRPDLGGRAPIGLSLGNRVSARAPNDDSPSLLFGNPGAMPRSRIGDLNLRITLKSQRRSAICLPHLAYRPHPKCQTLPTANIRSARQMLC